MALRDAGYEVHLIVGNTEDHIREGIVLHGVSVPRHRFGRLLAGNLRAFLKALQIQANAYHFHDPELIPSMLMLRVFGKRIIYDIHENLPAQIASKKYLGPLWMRRMLARPIDLFERISAVCFNGVVTVVPEIAARFQAKKTVVVRNLPQISLIQAAANNLENTLAKENKTLVYAGGLTEIRGIKECLSALEIINDPEIKLKLIGRWSSDTYYESCQKMKCWNQAVYEGEMSMDEVYKHLKGAHVGLCLLFPEPNYLLSLPVKAFEYMALGIPILMSDFPYWHRTFKECALFANPKNPEEIAKGIKLLLSDTGLSKQLGDAGRRLAEHELNWEKEKEILIDFYKRNI
jgi:glycosyltransferase involved in cell wall biosynthesis